MIKIPSSKEEFYMMAIRSYDPSCISIKEFKKDLRLIKKIHKELGKFHADQEVNMRSLLNIFLIIYNQFGEYAPALIFFDMSDRMASDASHFMVRLGRRCDLVDMKQLSINEKLIEELYQF